MACAGSCRWVSQDGVLFLKVACTDLCVCPAPAGGGETTPRCIDSSALLTFRPAAAALPWSATMIIEVGENRIAATFTPAVPIQRFMVQMTEKDMPKLVNIDVALFPRTHHVDYPHPHGHTTSKFAKITVVGAHTGHVQTFDVQSNTSDRPPVVYKVDFRDSHHCDHPFLAVVHVMER